MQNMTFTNLKYVKNQGDENVAIKFSLDGQEMSVLVNSVGNIHYDEIMKQVEAKTITIADAD